MPDPRPMPAGPLPVLYSFRRCPYAMRARLALLASGQRCELREVVLREKPPELLAASPEATVPVLVLPAAQAGDGGAAPDRVIVHSLDIMLWTLRRHDPLGWLTPGDGTLADLLALVEACDTGFKPDLDRYKYPNRHPQMQMQTQTQTQTRNPDTATAAADMHATAHVHRDRGAVFLQGLEDRLARHPHLAGDHATLADAAILPFVRQFAGVDPGWFAARPWPRLRGVLADWEGSDAFAIVMRRHAPWKAADGTGVAFP
jgi:glutathione S-transferase